MSLNTVNIQANEVRMPAPSRGIATKVYRYSAEQSVILHPADYEEYETLSALISAACELEGLEITELSERLHAEEEQPEGPIEDRETLLRIFGD